MEALADLRALGMDTVLLDVTDTAAITAAKEEIHSLTGGKLDILVNNACVLGYLATDDLLLMIANHPVEYVRAASSAEANIGTDGNASQIVPFLLLTLIWKT